MWREIQAVTKCEYPGYNHEDRDDAQESPYPQAARMHGGDFAIGGKAAESDEDADQHAHRNGVGERYWNGEEKDLSDARKRSAVAHYKFENAAKVAGEKNKGEDPRSDQGVGDNFSQNVAREDAHPQSSDSFASLA